MSPPPVGVRAGAAALSAAWRGVFARPILHVVLAAIALLALLGPALIVARAPTVPSMPARAQVRQRVVPPAELPPVEPTRFVALAPEDARTFNAAVPFAGGANPAARPFRFAGLPEDRARAVDCLAAAVLYEAGDDALGERAVAQVVLNRLRHPAFPKTVCGVVFQGSERTTGCQFTFTCDGALSRVPAESAWRRARAVAELALSGSVFGRVGYATHYHTDWVVPYWSASLDKVAEVHTHLFFRWSGWWGTPPAFNRRVTTGEPVIARLAGLSEAHRLGALPGLDGQDQTGAVPVGGTVPSDDAVMAALIGQEGQFLVTLPAGVAPEMLPAIAGRACGDRPYCKYLGWSDAARTPRTLPLEPAQIATMSFSYLRDRAGGIEKSLWNCERFKRPTPSQCMKIQVFMTAAPPSAVSPPASPPTVPRGPGELDGIRRRPVPGVVTPAATASSRSGPPDAPATTTPTKAAPAPARPAAGPPPTLRSAADAPRPTSGG